MREAENAMKKRGYGEPEDHPCPICGNGVEQDNFNAPWCSPYCERAEYV